MSFVATIKCSSVVSIVVKDALYHIITAREKKESKCLLKVIGYVSDDRDAGVN